MNIKEVLKGIKYKVSQENDFISFEIANITKDSRTVDSGSIYFAISNDAKDGHLFIREAIDKGAKAIVSEINMDQKENVPIILVENSGDAYALASANFYSHPSSQLTFIGITGTNGKTTSTYLLEEILKAQGYKPGVIGTINFRYLDKIHEAPNTTPEARDFQRLIHTMAEAGSTHVISEISSHGLALGRVNYTEIDLALFTNLTRDHLDFHNDFESYFKAKSLLFTELLKNSHKKNKNAVIMTGDEFGKRLYGILKSDFNSFFNTYSVSLEDPKTEVYAKDIKVSISGSTFNVKLFDDLIPFKTKLIGSHNIENILGVTLASYLLGVKIENIQKAMENFRFVPGRLERIENNKGKNVFVDYAHSPDALLNVLNSLKKVSEGKIITVFGCGGDRDKTKRPIMGEIAANLSDFVIVTSDNPRTEDPEGILNMIIPGVEKHVNDYIKEIDRRIAIEKAVEMARPQDIVLIAGKGHEDYQIIGKTKIHFSDQEIVREYLK